MKVDRIDVHANISVGGYVWAKSGFVPDPKEEKELITGFRKTLGTTLKPKKFKSLLDVAYFVISKEDYKKTKGSFASKSELRKAKCLNPDGSVKVGKFLLLETDWHGSLDTKSKEYKRFKRYSRL